jgi:hypothetical protein
VKSEKTEKCVKHLVGNLEIGTAHKTGEWWHVYVKGEKETIRFFIPPGESKATALATVLADMIRHSQDIHKHRWVSYVPKDKRVRKDANWFKCRCKAVICIPNNVSPNTISLQ